MGILLCGALWGQDAPAAPAAAPATTGSAAAPRAPARGTAAARPAGNPAPARPNYPPLNMNVSIHVKGKITADIPVDFTMTGCGPDFVMSGPLPEIEIGGQKYAPFSNCRVTIVATEGGYRLEYEIGCSVPTLGGAMTSMRSSAGTVTTSVTYRAVSTNSSVILKLGQSLTVSTSNGQELTLSLAAAE